MKRTTWAVVVAALLLALLWLGLNAGNDEAQEQFAFGAVDDLARVEIMPPTGAQGPELIVLERRRHGQWWISRPVEAPLDPGYGAHLHAIFGRPLGTDDLRIDAERAEAFDLTEETSVRVALFDAGMDRPTLELLVGRQMNIEQTGARRTFVMVPGGDVIYRAQAGFGDMMRLSVEEMQQPLEKERGGER